MTVWAEPELTYTAAELQALLTRAAADGIAQALTEERAAVRPLLVDLVAFVDQEHEYAVDSCHPQPGSDCGAWCEACKLIAQVPVDLLAEARQKLRGRGVER